MDATAHPLFDFAIESLRNFHGSETKFVELIADLLRARYRRDDLLKLFDDFLIDHFINRIWAIQKIAVACAQNRTDRKAAERYLSLLPADNRALARDEIAERRQASLIQRLGDLLAAPKSLDVLERIADLVIKNVYTLAQLDEASLRVVGMAVNAFKAIVQTRRHSRAGVERFASAVGADSFGKRCELALAPSRPQQPRGDQHSGAIVLKR